MSSPFSTGDSFNAGEYRRAVRTAYSDVRIPFRKDKGMAPAVAVLSEAQVAEVVEDSGFAAIVPLAPVGVPSITPAPGGGFGPFPGIFAALIGGAVIHGVFGGDSPDTPADSVGVPPTTPPDTTTGPPVTPPDTTTGPPVTPPDTTTGPPVTPPDTTTGPPVTPPDTTTGPPVTPPDTTTGPPVTPPEVPVTPTPEPSTMVLFASGLVACAALRVRKRRKGQSA